MANPNPYKARQAKAKRRRAKRGVRTAGDVQALREKLWSAIERAEELTGNNDPATALKAIHALAQAAGPYLKVIEIGEIEARIEALEQTLYDNETDTIEGTHSPTGTGTPDTATGTGDSPGSMDHV